MTMITTPTTTHRTVRGLSAVAIALLTGLGLTACGDDDNSAIASSGEGSPTGSATPASPDEDTSDSNSESDPSDSDIEEERGDHQPLNPAQCLVGDWLVDNDNYVDLYTPTHEMTVDSDGTVVVSFDADGQTTTEYVDWTFTMQQDGQEVTVIRNGIDGGTYAVDGDSLTMNETFSDSTVQMVIPGMSLEPQPKGEGGEMITSTVEFSCTAETLSMVAEGGTSLLTRQ